MSCAHLFAIVFLDDMLIFSSTWQEHVIGGGEYKIDLEKIEAIVKWQESTRLFFERVWVHFGIPCSIISDKNT